MNVRARRAFGFRMPAQQLAQDIVELFGLEGPMNWLLCPSDAWAK